jgi:hypothetical protein
LVSRIRSNPQPRAPAVRDASLRDLVAEYVRTENVSRDNDLAWYRAMPSLSEAIRIATFSLTRDRRRQPNQRRVPEEALAEAARRLARVRRLDRARDFDELLAMVTKACWAIRGFGTHTRYDVAFRIGLYLKKLPAGSTCTRGPEEEPKPSGSHTP